MTIEPRVLPPGDAALDELLEWWEDVRDRGIGSRAVGLCVPHGWGRSTVLRAVEEHARARDRPGHVTFFDAGAHDGAALQAAALVEIFEAEILAPPPLRGLGIQGLAGYTALALNAAGLAVGSTASQLLMLSADV